MSFRLLPASFRTGPVLAMAFGLLFASACGPAYPNCENDDNCKAKGEFCVDTKCAQCRVDNQCPGAGSDVCVSCSKGACGRKKDCCTSPLDCGSGRKCVSNACVAECGADGDCPAGQKCTGGACLAAGAAGGAGCTKNDDCSKGLRCDQGRCVDESGECSVAPVNFDFNEYTLSSQAQDMIGSSYKCMVEKKTASVTVEGHCDERGTDAYNMELGNRRARAVKEYLQTLAPKMKVHTMSYGKTKPVCTDDAEGCWNQNRRAEFK